MRSLCCLAVVFAGAACADTSFQPPQLDGGTVDGLECVEGVTRCSGTDLQSCQDGKYVTTTKCGPSKVCSTRLGRCAECDPSLQYGCKGGDVYVCQSTGTFGTKKKACLNGSCSGGACTDPCSVAEEKQSYIGCSYWPTVTINSGLPRDFTFAVVVANASTTDAATVTIATKSNTKLKTATVPASSTATIELQWVADLKQTTTTRASIIDDDGAYHLTSTLPVTVYQFNPLEFELKHECTIDQDTDPYDGKCNSYTNDASLLLPEHALGKNHLIVTRPTMGLIVGGTQMIGYPGFFSVVAASSGTTKVDVVFSSDTMAGSGSLDAYKKGDKASFTLSQWGVLQILSEVPQGCTPVKTDSQGYGYCDLSANNDLTGTTVTSSQGVAVFVGHDCTFVPYDKWACDHLEEQLYPLEAWGKDYIGAHTKSSGSDPNVYRIVSAADKNKITFDPSSVHATVTLDKGKFVEFESAKDFEVKGSSAFLVSQFMVGQGYSNPTPMTGAPNDPSMALAVPVEQYRTSYRFLAPSSYTQNYVNVIAPTGTTVKLDGTAIASSEFVPIGAVDLAKWMVAKLAISGGVHTVEAAKASGIAVYGVASYTSYMYPGGLDLKDLLK
jgi:hypothetical protein